MFLLILVAIVGSLLVIPAVYLVFFFGWSPTVPARVATEDLAPDESTVD